MILKTLHGSGEEAQIAALGQRMFAESRFSRLGFDHARAAAYSQVIAQAPGYISVGAFDGAELAGLVCGPCGATLPFSSAVVSNQHLLYVVPEHRSPWLAAKLVHAFIEESKRRQALDITFSNGTGYEPDRVGKLFEVCGLTRVGGLYVMEA